MFVATKQRIGIRCTATTLTSAQQCATIKATASLEAVSVSIRNLRMINR
ncbi:MAG: hypothetical protein ACHBN1_19340 [Heteroscytonema crispum UTEX LB 1556]